MPIHIPVEMRDKMETPATAPIFLVQHSFSGVTEYCSSAGDVTLDGNLYSAGGCNIRSIQDSATATIEFFATPQRIAALNNGLWRDGECIIHYIAAVPGEASKIYTSDDAILVLNGEMSSANYPRGNSITVGASQSRQLSRVTPGHTWDMVSNHCPSPGTEIVWDDGRYILQSQYIPPGSNQKAMTPTDLITGLPASVVHRLAQPSELMITTTGASSLIKLIYGYSAVAGDIIAIGAFGSNLVMAVGWGYGEVGGIDKFFINDVEIPDGGTPGTDITFTHYRGSYNQKPDLTLELSIAGFSDRFVLDLPAGAVGCAYTVVMMPPSEVQAAPTFKALIEGKAVNDSRLTGDNDPDTGNDVFAISFANPMDVSPGQLPFSIEENATITRNKLDCSAGGYMDVPYDSSLEIPDETDVTLSTRFTVGPVNTSQYIAGSAMNAALTNRGWSLEITAANELKFYVSVNGTSYATGYPKTLVLGVAPGDTFVFSWLKDGATDENKLILDGREVLSYTESDGVFNDGSSGIVVGARSDGVTTGQRFFGTVDFFRLTIGGQRLRMGEGYPHSALPFPEYARYTDTSILCAADLIENPVYGLGTEVIGLDAAADWNEGLRDGEERARLSLVIATPQSTVSYVDLLVGEYAECFWFNDQEKIKVVPNSAASIDDPTGQQVVHDSEMASGDGWTITAPGVGHAEFTEGKLVVPGTQAGIFYVDQTVDLDVGATYILTVAVNSISAGGYAVELGGVEVLPSVALPGERIYAFDATTATALVRLRFGASTICDVDYLRIRRLVWNEKSIVDGSLQISPSAEDQAPTNVSTKYMGLRTDSPNWQTVVSEPIKRVGVDTGEVRNVATTLVLDGIFREVEATWKSKNKLSRYDNRVTYVWETTDTGVRHRKGDIVEINSTPFGLQIFCRVVSATMVSYGRYRVTGERYSASQYPSQIDEPTTTGTVPVGAIVLLSGTAPPTGWDLFTAPNGSLIVGAGGDHDPADTGGSATHPGFTGSTTEDDAHESDDGGTYMYTELPWPRPTGDPTSTQEYVEQDPPSLLHKHDYDTGELAIDLYRRRQRLMIKTGTPGATLPPEAQVFGLNALSAEGLQRLTTNAGRLLEAANAQANAGVAVQTVSPALTTTSINHKHFAEGDLLANHEPWTFWAGAPYQYYNYVEVLSHSHEATAVLDRNVKKIALALYGSNGNYNVVPGMYFLWSGSLGSLPTDFVLADGANGTDDCRDFFLEIAFNGGEGVFGGNNTLELRAPTTTGGEHEHAGSSDETEDRRYFFKHADLVRHSHTLEASDDWVPKYYALAVIMYKP